MQPVGGKKAADICILTILKNYSDEDHPLTQKDIIDHLENDYGITLARNAVSRTISLLRELGYDIGQSRNNRGVFLSDRDFEDSELQFLIDCVRTSRYIPENDAGNLIRKISGMSTKNFNVRQINVNLFDGDICHRKNREFFLNLELIEESRAKRKKIRFRYYNYPFLIEQGMKEYEEHTVTVSELYLSNNFYYVEGIQDGECSLCVYRVDLIRNLEILDKDADTMEKLSKEKYGREFSISIFRTHKKEKIVLIVEKRIIRYFFDCIFRKYEIDEKDIKIEEHSETEFRVTFNTYRDNILRWILDFDGWPAKIAEPENIKKEICLIAESLLKQHGN